MKRKRRLLIALAGVSLLACLQGTSARFLGSQKSPESSIAEPTSLVSADLDGDGHIDLIGGYADSAGTRLVVFRNTGSASNILREIFRLDLPVRPDFIATGDFNADGFIDVVVAARPLGARAVGWSRRSAAPNAWHSGCDPGTAPPGGSP